MESDDIIKKIKKLGLKPSLKRNLSLLSMSGVAYAYINQTKKILGFGYNAVGSLKNQAGIYTLINEDDIKQKIGKLIKKNNIKIINKYLEIAFELYEETEPKISDIKKIIIREDYDEAFKKIYNIAIDSYTAISVYNCLLRFLGNDEGALPKYIIKRVGKERNIIAKQYALLEKLLQDTTAKMKLKNKADGKALQFLLRDELEKYFRNELNNEKVLELFNKRKEGYIFIYDGQKENIWNKKSDLKKVNDLFWTKFKKNTIIKGSSAFKGKSGGEVYLINDNSKYKKPKSKYIVVAAMTHPDLITLIKNSEAIITDEGGLLCHAAIIARELKKPCIIGTKIATQVLHDGDLVEVDADKGVVKILKRK